MDSIGSGLIVPRVLTDLGVQWRRITKRLGGAAELQIGVKAAVVLVGARIHNNRGWAEWVKGLQEGGGG